MSQEPPKAGLATLVPLIAAIGSLLSGSAAWRSQFPSWVIAGCVILAALLAVTTGVSVFFRYILPPILAWQSGRRARRERSRAMAIAQPLMMKQFKRLGEFLKAHEEGFLDTINHAANAASRLEKDLPSENVKRLQDLAFALNLFSSLVVKLPPPQNGHWPEAATANAVLNRIMQGQPVSYEMFVKHCRHPLPGTQLETCLRTMVREFNAYVVDQNRLASEIEAIPFQGGLTRLPKNELVMP